MTTKMKQKTKTQSKFWIFLTILSVFMSVQALAINLELNTDIVQTPIHYGDKKGEAELFGYNPQFSPNVVAFDNDNNPYIVPRDQAGIIQTTDSNGNWIQLDIAERITNTPRGDWLETFRDEVIFDKQGDAYMLADGTGKVDGVWTWLIHSRDNCRSWTIYPVPIPQIPHTTHPDYPEHTTTHIRPIIERRNSANLTTHPPVIVSSDGKHLLLVVTERTANGKITFKNPVEIENVEGDWKAPINIVWAGDWGNWGNKFVMHEPVVSSDDKVHMFWSRPYPVECNPGTPAYAATYNRKTGKVSERVFLGSNGHQIDGHNRPSAAIDKDGYIHVILGCHATIQHPHEHFKYVRSLKPNDTSAGFTEPIELPIPPRELYPMWPGGCSYPSMVCDDDGTLHVIGRQYDVEAMYEPGIYTTGEGLLLTRSRLAYYRKLPGKDWEYDYLVRNFHPAYSLWFHKITKDNNNRIFIGYRHQSHAFELRGIKHAPSLLVSDDSGVNWRLAVSKDLIGDPQERKEKMTAIRKAAPKPQRDGPVIGREQNSPKAAYPLGRRIDTALSDEEFFAALDLTNPKLSKVKDAINSNNKSVAISALADYYRNRELKGHWWNSSIEPVDPTSGRRSYESVMNMYDRKPPFAAENWNEDGSYDWLRGADYRQQRMYFMSNIGQAWRYSKDPKVIDVFNRLYQSWIEQFPYDGKNANPAWATMVTGIRLRTGLGDAFAAISSAKEWDDASMFLFLKSFYEQAKQLRNHHSQTSNWLTFELAGLYSAGVLLPEFKDAADWRDHAMQTALNDIDHGWLPDGMSVELSPGYGQFFVNFLQISDLAVETGQADPRAKQLVSKCEDLFTTYLKLMSPNRLTPALNDNRAVNVPEFLSKPFERFPHRKDFQWAVSGGKKGSKPQYLSLAFPYAGYTIIRSGWEKDANYLCFIGGPIGYRHANQHKLSIVFNAYGREIIYDPGASAYNGRTNELYQQYVYDTFSHSTGIVDNRPQRRKWYSDPHPDNMPYKEAEDFEYQISDKRVWTRGLYKSHYGKAGSIGNDAYPYKKGGNFSEGWVKPATHERQIFYIAPDIFLVQDIFTPTDNQSHEYDVRWQIDSVKTQLDNMVLQTKDPKQPNMAIVPLWTDGLKVESVSAQNKPEVIGWKVIDADNPQPATTLRHIQQGTGKKQFLTLLYPIRKDAECPSFEFSASSGTLRIGDKQIIQISAADNSNSKLRAVER